MSLKQNEVVQGMEREQGDVQNNLSRYGEGLPKDRSPQELNTVIPQAEDGLQNKDNVEKTYNSKK